MDEIVGKRVVVVDDQQHDGIYRRIDSSVKRGAYGGAVGWLSYGGDLDTCICIRTVVVKEGVAHVQAGGGTVADARPDYEYEESRAKARGVVRAIELAARQADWA